MAGSVIEISTLDQFQEILKKDKYVRWCFHFRLSLIFMPIGVAPASSFHQSLLRSPKPRLK